MAYTPHKPREQRIADYIANRGYKYLANSNYDKEDNPAFNPRGIQGVIGMPGSQGISGSLGIPGNQGYTTGQSYITDSIPASKIEFPEIK